MTAGRWLPCVAAATVLVAACGGDRAAAPLARNAAALTVAVGVDPDTLDPMRQTTTAVSNIVAMVVESLTAVDRDGRIQPSLATAWEEAPDAMSWTFALRQGVRFSDGAPLDADAVRDSLERTLDPANRCTQCDTLPAAVAAVEVVDPAHVRLAMRQPLASGIVLGLLGQVPFGIVSPRAIERGTPTYGHQEHPIGTGPYVLEDRVAGARVALVRNDRYWGRRPAYARQVFLVVPDAATREALVRSGQADVILLPPVSDLPILEADATVRVLLAPSDRLIFLAIDTADTRQPLLRNRQVRQALNYAVNREAIIGSTLFGAAEPATSAMPPGLFGYCAQPPYGYDPDLARRMLQRNGASDLRISLIAPTGRYIQDFQAARNVAAQLRAVGVRVDGPTTMPWPDYVRTILAPQDQASVDVHMLGFAAQFLDGYSALTMYDAGQAPPRGQATSYYDSPTVTALLATAATESHRDARAREYCEAQAQIWSDAPVIFLWVQKFPIVSSAHVADVGSILNDSFTTVYARPA